MKESAMGPRTMEGQRVFSQRHRCCKCFAAQCGLSPWLVSVNDSVTQGPSKVQRSGSRRLSCSQTQLETEAGVSEARFNMHFGENKMYSAIWTA